MEQVQVVRVQRHVDEENGVRHEVQVVAILMHDVMEQVREVHVQRHVQHDTIVQQDQVDIQNVQHDIIVQHEQVDIQHVDEENGVMREVQVVVI